MVLLESLQTGGAQRLAVDLAATARRGAYRPVVVVTKSGGPLEEDLAAARVPYVVLGRTRRYQLRGARTALRIARTSDLVHAHLFGMNVWGALLARAVRIPLLAHEHNRVARLSLLESALNGILVGRTAQRVICVSEGVATAVGAAGIPPEKIVVVPNGVRLDRALPRAAARAALGLAAEDVVLGTVACLRPEKAHDVLLTAFARLAAAGRDGLRLCVVGDGTECRRLHELARSLGVADRVTWAGDRADAAAIVSAFDVFVLSSRTEGLPIATLECLAAGVPLVATRVGALPGLIADGAGVLFAPGDPVALAAAVEQVLADPAAARALAARGREVVAARHDLRETVRRVEALYVEMLAANRRRGARASPGAAGLDDGRVTALDIAVPFAADRPVSCGADRTAPATVAG